MNYEYWKPQLTALANLFDKNKAVATALIDVRNAVAARVELYESGLKTKFQQAKATVARQRTSVSHIKHS